MALALVLALSGTARGDAVPNSPGLVDVPIECAPYLKIPGGVSSPAAWNAVLSFAACIQDASVYRLEHGKQLAGFVEQQQAALAPALQLYVIVIEKAPDPVKLRAVYYVGLGQVALITRARASIVSPALRAPLEILLEPHARLAYLLFTAVDRAASSDPKLATDVVARNMVRSARVLAAALRSRWSRPPDDGTRLRTLMR